jgi:hypothetical protein
MASSLKSLSQIWNKTSRSDGAAEEITHTAAFNGSGSRRQLSRQFKSVSDATTSEPPKRLLRSRGVLSSISNLNVGNVPKETRKLIQAGADKVNQTLNDVRNTFGTWSQVYNFKSLSLKMNRMTYL